MRWTLWRRVDERSHRRTAKSCGPGAPTLALSSRGSNSAGVTVANKPGTPGRSRISRKTIAQGRPGDLGNTCGDYPVLLSLHRGRGCGQHPAFPAPSYYSRVVVCIITRVLRAAGIRVCIQSSLRAKGSRDGVPAGRLREARHFAARRKKEIKKKVSSLLRAQRPWPVPGSRLSRFHFDTFPS